ncbi:MAG: thymidine phosphorylase [Hyphomonadaceae bacterium]
MLFQDVIYKKREGHALDGAEIEAFAQGLADGSLPAEQASALAMAIFFRGMTAAEAGVLTAAMARTGAVLEWRDLPGPVVDKHSTGGVGDKVSLMLAPIAAACGCFVPMISGRGLGHTGGTLDKMEAIPGYNATPDLDAFRKVVREVGCAIIGQTGDLAPADRRLYAIRDVTATVESIPLITASILSKKIAAGLSALVMDVKTGSGAFMPARPQAEALARSLIDTGAAAGLPIRALITDMDQPLGFSAGNALETAEAIAYLRNDKREARLDAVVLALAAEMLVLGGIEKDAPAARARAVAALESGRAGEVFARMTAELGGPADIVERAGERLAQAPVVIAVHPARAGFVEVVDTRAIGLAIIELGGGRRKTEDRIDFAVGFADFAPIGAAVGPDRPLAFAHARSENAAEVAAAALRAAYRIGNAPSAPAPAVIAALG